MRTEVYQGKIKVLCPAKIVRILGIPSEIFAVPQPRFRGAPSTLERPFERAPTSIFIISVASKEK